MTYEITYSTKATAQSLAWLAWLRTNLGPRAEERAIAAVERMEVRLRKQPTSSRLLLRHPRLGYLRVTVAYHHRFVYAVDDANERVEVVYISHEKGDRDALVRNLANLG